jgi:nucleoside-diphosphate-sugar epimerase
MSIDSDIAETINSMVSVSAEVNAGIDVGKAAPALLMANLTSLTQRLTRLKCEAGQLSRHPCDHVRQNAPRASGDVGKYLRGKCVLVTGAGGLIGTMLCRRLVQEYDLQSLILLERDEKNLTKVAEHLHRRPSDVRIEPWQADVADSASLRKVFCQWRPQIVFHLAAQRSPGASEVHVRDAILTNIQGTESASIHASTGKCRFLYEDRVYPATKKFAEVVVRTVADASEVRCSLVRFHHVVDNSIAEQTFRNQIQRGEPLTVHLPPGRSKQCQSAQEAVTMLLNAGAYGRKAELFGSKRQMDYFSVLDLALYVLKESGKELPILFKEPKRSEGYDFKEFAGIRLADDAKRLTYSFNLIETDGFQKLPALGLVVVPFPTFKSDRAMAGVRRVLDMARTGEASAAMMKKCLFKNLFDLAVDVYSGAPPRLLVTAFVQGVNEESLTEEDVGYHLPTLRILLRALCLLSPAVLDHAQRDSCRKSLVHLDGILIRAGRRDELAEELDSCKSLIR